MTKSSDKLANAIARIAPKFLSVGSFIYYRDPVLMLRGFAFDMPPGGCYIWKYYLPLFGDVEFLNMSLGHRIRNGYLETRGKDLNQLTREALDVVNENDDFSDEESLEDMISFAKGDLISPIERSKLFSDIEIFQRDSFENIIKRAEKNRKRVGIGR